MGRASRIDFCCFGIPLINVGAYTICVQFAVIALCVVILAVAPPQIVATMGALPSGFPKIIVCILGVIALLWQAVGIAAIKREANRMYRTYIRVNFILTLVTIIVTLVFFAVAAARHSTALAACTAAYGNPPLGSQSLGSELDSIGSTICNIFIWAQVGFMGLLIILIGLTQLYMCAVQRAYGKEMRHAMHDAKIYASPGDEIPLATRGSDVWGTSPTRGSDEYGARKEVSNSISRNVPLSSHESGREPHFVQESYPSYASYGAPRTAQATDDVDASTRDSPFYSKNRDRQSVQAIDYGYGNDDDPRHQRQSRHLYAM